MTGWTTAFTGDEDDDSVEIPLGYSTDFNTSSYSSVFIGSNTYFTFGEGSSHYYNLAANNPPFPGVHMCAGDHSYQRVFYKLDDADTMRVRYEGTNETSGTEGEPNIVYEALFHKNSSTINLYMGVNAGCIDPSNQSYTLHYSAGAHGSLTGNDNQTVAYGADGSEITAVPDEGYHFTKWSDDSTNNPRTDQSVSENIDVTANFELIPESADEVWVDDDYNSGNTGSHTWETDAFDNIPDAINAVSENGTVHVSAGIYDSTSPITINKKIDLVGPGVAEVAEANRAILINTDNGDDPAYCSGIRKLLVVLSIEASYTHVSGFEITSECNAAPVVRVGTSSNPVEGVVSVENVVIDDNEISGGQHGISVRHDTESTTISNNIIHGALDPNYHSWGKGGITLGSSPNNQIFGNNIYENYNGITMYYGGEESWIDGQFGETEIYNNNIHNNRNAGIYFSATDQADTMTIGPDNEITENADGIYVSGNAHNVLINGNQIYSNTNPRSALHVENASTGLDATENWWGDESGPYEENNNSAATGDAISIENSDFIYFRPFCLDEGCENMRSYPVDADNLTSLFSNGGTMTVPEGEDQNDVSEINVREDTIISVETGSGTTKITLPAGTIITRSDDSNFNIGDLSASGIELSSLSGFDTGITVAGAVQWGIPDLGLSFNQPIKIDLYVGTDLSGQTLAIRRSSSMDSGWTDDGIVAPGTCVVSSEGICSFETTKASYYSALDGITQDDNNNNDDNTSQKDTAQKAHIKSWNASLVTDLSSCPEKIKLNLTGKHFKDSSDVRIGGHKADWMDVKYSNKLSAKFCLADLLSGRPASSRTVSVKNPDTDTEKADKKIDLSQFIPSSDNTLASPQSSEDVKSIQRELNKLGLLDESSITGIYGPLTTEAVKKFQADNGLPTTGFVGPLTRAKLEEKTK